jgi:hypothetical protein
MTASTPDIRKPVTPDERQAMLPVPPVATSAALGWPDLRVEHYRGEPDVELQCPPRQPPPAHPLHAAVGVVLVSQ